MMPPIGTEYCRPGVNARTGPPIVRKHAQRRLGYAKDEMTAHGFRAAASSILNESGLWNPDAIEAQLAHVEGNAVRRAYARAEFWEERVNMMRWWADKLDELQYGGEVVSFVGKRSGA